MFYLGIDSGGTKAAFLLGDENGRIYARYRGEGCTVLSGHKAGIKQMVAEGVAAVCKAAGITSDDIDCLGLGISCYGEGENSEVEPFEACAEVLSPDRVICQCDTYVGWAGSLHFQPGVNVIAGTGAVAYGVNAAGETARSSGWGAWSAGCDEGSCTWHGQRLVQEWTKQADGRRPRTAMYTMFREHFHVTCDDEHFITTLNETVLPGRGLPELQRLLAKMYDAGDPIAAQIYEEGAEELCCSIQAVAQKLGFTGTDYPVSYTGGLFKSGECALAPLRRRIERAGAHLVDPELPPDVGALMMAIHHKHPERDLRDFRIIE